MPDSAEMKMNTKMCEMLKAADISIPFPESGSSENSASYEFTIVDGSLLLKDEHEKAKHVEVKDFPDKTGFEAFVNHVHLLYDGTRVSLLSCLRSATVLQKGLFKFGEGRMFLVILSISDGGGTLRFHQRRPNENWLAGDLEGYSEEAILVLSVGSPDQPNA